VVGFAAEKFASEGDHTRPSGDETVHQHLARAHATFERNPELAIVLQELALRAQRDATTRVALRSLFRFWNRQVEGAIEAERGGAGTIGRGVGAPELALVVTSFVMGAMTQHGVEAKAVPFEALALELERLIAQRPRDAR